MLSRSAPSVGTLSLLLNGGMSAGAGAGTLSLLLNGGRKGVSMGVVERCLSTVGAGADDRVSVWVSNGMTSCRSVVPRHEVYREKLQLLVDRDPAVRKFVERVLRGERVGSDTEGQLRRWSSLRVAGYGAVNLGLGGGAVFLFGSLSIIASANFFEPELLSVCSVLFGGTVFTFGAAATRMRTVLSVHRQLSQIQREIDQAPQSNRLQL